MVPTSVMGIFTGIFLWVFVGFLWDKDIKDFMQFMAGLSVIVTFILEFVCKLNVKKKDFRSMKKTSNVPTFNSWTLGVGTD